MPASNIPLSIPPILPDAGLSYIYCPSSDQPSAGFPPSPGYGQSQERRTAGGEVSSSEQVWILSTQTQWRDTDPDNSTGDRYANGFQDTLIEEL